MAEAFFESQPSSKEICERIKGYPSWIEIDVDALGFNLDQIRERVKVEIIPCVKTNAYGHGIVPVVAFLMKYGVARVLVAKLWEAVQLRMAGLDCGVINMDPIFTEGQYRWIIENNVVQTVFSKSVAEKLNAVSMNLGKPAEIFLKIDTGLGRVGVRHEKALGLIKHVSSLQGLKIMGMFSTFTEIREFDKIQLERMLALDRELRKNGIQIPTKTMASSNAIFHFQESYLDAVRPGLMLYGLYPEPEDRGVGLELKSVMCMKARLEHVKWIEKGDTLTYSRRFVAPKRMKVGTIHAGYSDGFPRGLTNKGLVRVGRSIKPVLGAVSVNHHIVDLDHTDVEVGDIVEIVSREGENTIERLSNLAGIMPYSFCVGLNPFTPRVYCENAVPKALCEYRQVIS